MGGQLLVGHPILCQDGQEPLPHWPAFYTHSPDPGPSSRILSQSCCWHKVAASHVPSLWGPERDMIPGSGQVGEANQTKAELGTSLVSSPQHAWAGGFLPSCPTTCPVQGPQTGSTTVGAGHQMARTPPTTTTTRQTDRQTHACTHAALRSKAAAGSILRTLAGP